MGRPLNADAKATWKSIRTAGVRLLFKHGYEAMNLRELAAESGLKPGSLYNYFSSKNEFLNMILWDIMEAILADLEKIVDPVEETRARLKKFIEFHIAWHTARGVETFISFMEMRNLSKESYKKYTTLRRQYENFLTDILVKGVDEGKFSMADCRVSTFAILAMLTGSNTWYKKRGRLSQEQLVAIYTEMVFKLVEAPQRSAAASNPLTQGKRAVTAP